MQLKGIWIQLMVGIVFAGSGFYLVKSNMAFKKTALVTTGQITAFETHTSTSSNNGVSYTYSPVFEYEVGGVKQIGHSNMSSSSRPEIGKPVKVLYQPTNPANSKIYSWFDLFGFGLLFAASGAGVLMHAYFRFDGARNRNNEIQDIKRGGTVVLAKFVAVVPEKNGIEVNGEPRMMVQASYWNPESQQIQIFMSDPMWNLPNPMATELRVYLHPKNKSRYYMEVTGPAAQKVA